MATETTPTTDTPENPAPAPDRKPARQNTTFRRFLIGTNVLIQILIVFAIVALVNYVSFRQYKRWDLSRSQKYALAPMTNNLLRGLDEPVQAIVFFPSAQILYTDVTNLLREYEYAGGNKFRVEFVDPYRNLTRAQELAEKYKFGASDNIVILDYKGKNKFVNAQDMAEMDMSGAMFGQPPAMKSFKGEQAITSALLELTEEKQSKLYVLAGHGGVEIDGGQFATFQAFAGRQNLSLAPLNLNNVDSVPADATSLLILGPRTDFSEREIQLLSEYWTQRNGRVFVALGPDGRTPRLDEFLAEQGVRPANDRILRTQKMPSQDASGNIALVTGIIVSPAVTLAPEGREITRELAGITTQLPGATQSLDLDPGKAQMMKLKTTPLMTSAEGFWGETDYVPGQSRAVFFDPKKDRSAPLTVGVALEKGAVEDPRVKVETARMIVLGNSGVVTDDGTRVSDISMDLTLNAVNWLIDREELAGIAPKEKKPVELKLSESQMGQLALAVLAIIPSIAGIIGFAVWWQRRT